MNRNLSTWMLGVSAAAIIAAVAGCSGTSSPATGGQPIAEVTSAARELESHDRDDRESDHDRVTYFESIFDRLREVPQLAPLFDQYGVPAPTEYDEHDDDVAGLRTLLRAVRITIADGNVRITNRQTGQVIYSAPLRDLDSGVFHPENVPGGTTSPSTCTAFTYSAWGACTNGTQTRTVATSSPSGCTGGTPVLSQACTATLDGAALYASKCAGCHGPLATSNLIGKNMSVSSIKSRNMTQGLTDPELQAIVNAVNGVTPAPATCTSFTYSAWGACVNGTQTRTVATSSPSGCTGGTPVLSQACTITPPACTYTTGAWGACQPNGTQTRTVTAAPSGCVGTPPASTQACTYVPPVTTCTSFSYSAWGACQSNGSQTRTVTASSPAGCTGGTPVLSQSCTYVPPACTYTYSAWGACQSNGTQTRTMTGSSPSGCTGTPVLSQSCTYVPPVCTSFTYSAWSACVNGSQTRTVSTSSPAGCTGGTPVLTQACTVAPDGVALYGQYCAGCHGQLATSNLKGRNMTVTSIKSRNMTQGLTDAQLQAIVNAVGP